MVPNSYWMASILWRIVVAWVSFPVKIRLWIYTSARVCPPSKSIASFSWLSRWSLRLDLIVCAFSNILLPKFAGLYHRTMIIFFRLFLTLRICWSLYNRRFLLLFPYGTFSLPSVTICDIQTSRRFFLLSMFRLIHILGRRVIGL